MSVITYRDGVMAADSRAFSGSHRPLGQKVKIRRFESGVLVGVGTSVPGLGEWLLDTWWDDECPDIVSLPIGCQDKSFDLLAIRPDGSALFASDALVLAGPITAPYFAIGTGGSYALGAMHAGACAVEAVRAAIEHDPVCRGPVASLTHMQDALKWH